MRGEDLDALIEEAVAAHAIPAEAGHLAGNLEGGPAVDAGSLHPRRLAGRLVGHYVLEEDNCAVIAVPDHLVLLEVLDEQAIRGHAVAVDYHSRVGGVRRPAHSVPVTSTPDPQVVQPDRGTVHDETRRSLTR